MAVNLRSKKRTNWKELNSGSNFEIRVHKKRKAVYVYKELYEIERIIWKRTRGKRVSFKFE